MKRKYADYLADEGPESPDADLKPSKVGPSPARAWLQLAEEDDDPDGPPFPAAEPSREWTMTLEMEGGATNHEGSFEELVALAVNAGVDEFHVWSPSRSDFEVLTAETVRPLE